MYILQYQSNYYVLLIFIVTFGLSAGARGPIITSLIAKIFAGSGLASIYGASNLGQGIGAATGALAQVIYSIFQLIIILDFYFVLFLLLLVRYYSGLFRIKKI